MLCSRTLALRQLKYNIMRRHSYSTINDSESVELVEEEP